MARLEIDGMDDMLANLRKLGSGIRPAVKQIVTAGAKAETGVMSGQIEVAKHVVTGTMAGAVDLGRYKETLGGGEIDVYPQGEDSRGVSNAKKAFVINYGLGGNPTRRGKKNKTGDKFITGKKHEREAEEAVTAAMEAEAEKAFQEMGITE